MKDNICSSHCRCICQSDTNINSKNGTVTNGKTLLATNYTFVKLKPNAITDIYINCMLLTCILITIFVFSRPFTEHFIIRLIFGESLNYCNYTYIPSKYNYRRPYKLYN
ncbi:unnamed protein product [Schistosoma margrebowiei]|uniref:ODV-E66 n=1 Tax=Schistosoma margrebowiei TaxID=48269 RepID=A0AA84ZSM4_9TREM|nr:unnamed protein product [Schistosoma margrebowiei]